ncbi:MAG: DUF3696 domain-containing protein [Pseudomonadota bacterium]
MLTSWRLNNFKSVQAGSFDPKGAPRNPDKGQGDRGLVLGPLTVLAGPNSSGKSSIIQSILLMAQTLRSRKNPGLLHVQDDLVRLGGFDQILSSALAQAPPAEKSLTIGWSLTLDGPDEQNGDDRRDERAISCDFEFDGAGKSAHDSNLFPSLKWARIDCRTDANGDASQIEIQRKSDDVRAGFQVAIQPEQAAAQLLEPHERGTISDCVLTNILPESLEFSFDSAEEEAEFVVSVLKHTFRSRLAITDRLAYKYADPLFDIIIPETVLNPDLLSPFAPLDVLIRPVTPWEWLRNLWIAYGKPSDSSADQSSRRENWQSLRETVNRNASAIKPAVKGKCASETDEADRLEGSPDISSEGHGQKDKRRHAGDRPDARKLPATLADAIGHLESKFADSIRYLGPLREPPKQIYPLSGGIDSKDVGLAGEYTAYVLLRHGGESITYIPPHALDRFTDRLHAVDLYENVTLMEAVDEWLQYLGAALGVKVNKIENLGIELKVLMEQPDAYTEEEIIEDDGQDEPSTDDAGQEPSDDADEALPSPDDYEYVADSPSEMTGYYLNQVGVGVSQVLPILVMCLLQEKGALLLLEQPELHLHPKVQSRLADFFISMALRRKQCIVETHGEHWINRLRLRIAESEGTDLADMTKVYFVTKSRGRSHFRLVHINPYGAIEEWPKNFFDQQLGDVAGILKAGWEKRERNADEQTDSGS